MHLTEKTSFCKP